MNSLCRFINPDFLVQLNNFNPSRRTFITFFVTNDGLNKLNRVNKKPNHVYLLPTKSLDCFDSNQRCKLKLLAKEFFSSLNH